MERLTTFVDKHVEGLKKKKKSLWRSTREREKERERDCSFLGIVDQSNG